MRRHQQAPKNTVRVEKLSRDGKRLIQYWRESITEGERETLKPETIRNYSTRISAGDFERGHCAPENYRSLVAKNNRQDRRRKPEDDGSREDQTKPLPVLVCPLRFAKKGNSDSGPPYLEILWLPALLLPNGVLSPPSRKQPWIDRNVLEPSGSDESPVVGTIRAVEKFSLKHGRESWTDWSDYLSYAESLLSTVTGSNRRNLKIPGYERKEDALLVFDRSSSGATATLVQLLGEVLDGELDSGVLAKFACISDPKPIAYRDDKGSFAKGAKLHLGHFTEAFPLSASQRKSVHRFLDVRKKDFMTITGPPGTGKTTVIQSIIASLWVRAAVSGADSPPVIVCTGATNQSVINIIDSFEKAPVDGQPLSGRWLPRVHSYGTFCASATKAADVQHYQLELRDGSGLSSMMESENYRSAAGPFFLERFAACFGKRLSLAQATKFLHRMIVEEHRLLVREIDNLSQLGLWSFLQSLFSPKKMVSPEQFALGVAQLDITRRNQLFLLATHYWEARWLQKAQEEHSRKSTSRRDDGRLDSRRFAWERRAMITPAFVSTISMLPRFFPFNRRNPVAPVDVLICDEAGQIPIELGAAVLPIADRVLIVGDCLQLEPYWDVQPHTDRAILHKNNIAENTNEAAWKDCQERGILSSSGSLMKLALRSMANHEGNQRGCFLNEQRRSVPEIVAFSNALAYDNQLQAKRRPLSPRILPAFGYINVRGRAEQSGSSRMNRNEITAIIDWLLEKEEELKDFYRQEDISDVIAIITPFAAQHREIRRRLPERLRKMTVGTVGGLQGAERPVVLFSPVYDETFDDRYFFDLNVNLLNVAVSRARDSFIVFGNISIFDKKAKTPSGYLANFLFASPENELPLPQKTASAEKQIPADAHPKRISTLDEHVHVLREAFIRAEQEVLIVSATISSAALKRDGIPDLIRDAVQRNVRVSIYVDYDLNREGNAFKPRAEEAFEMVKSAGAELHLVARTHLKVVAMDGYTLAEGSFNWLSANRNESNRHSKQEWSTLTYGKWAAEQIEQLKVDLDYRVKALDDLIRMDSEGEF